jgi:hypothetical protein
MDVVRLEALSSIDEDSSKIVELSLPASATYEEYVVNKSYLETMINLQAILSRAFRLQATGFCCKKLLCERMCSPKTETTMATRSVLFHNEISHRCFNMYVALSKIIMDHS